jgi:vancomycin permeability regulator SanA
MRSPLRRKLAWTAGAVAAALLVAFAGIAASNAWVARAARGRAYASVDAVPSRSVAIVPGARVVNGKPFVHLEARLQMALTLYQGGRVKSILVSGNETAESAEVKAMTEWLLERGVDRKDIIADTAGSRTRETMNRAADVFDVHDAVICTQDVNVERTVYLAQAAGIDAVAVGAPSNLARSVAYVRDEMLKTTLAVIESLLPSASPSQPAERAPKASIAAR